jgi:outer membrane protein
VLKNFILITLFFLSAHSFANLSKIAGEFLQVNSAILVGQTNVELGKLDYQSLLLTKTWNMNYSYSYADSSLESSSTLLASPTETTAHAFSLIKDFEWGGQLTFENTLTGVDSSALGNKFYGFSQGLSYSQSLGKNFLGRQFYKDKNSASLNMQIVEVQQEDKIQNSFLELVGSYAEAQLNKELVRLQKDAKVRAERRLDLIRRRVRDGLREKVDLYQAQISVYNQVESIKSSEQNLLSSLEKLSKSLHRNVSTKEVGEFAPLEEMKIPEGTLDQNLSIKLLSLQEKVLTQTHLKTKDSLMPKVTLTAGVSNNDFNNTQSTAMSDGLLGGDHDELSVALVASWPIGSRPQKIERTKAMIKLKRTEMEKGKTKLNFIEQEISIKGQLSLLEENIQSVQKRKDLAVKTLKEYNKLYTRGRADLDQVIRSEETLINTEISIVQYMAQWERLTHSLAHLYGRLKQHILIKE